MSKHSPGPWNWGPDKMDGENTLLDANGDDVAYAYHYDDHVRVPNETDARLIAAAPELLGLLKDALWRLRGAGHDGLACDAEALIRRIEEGI